MTRRYAFLWVWKMQNYTRLESRLSTQEEYICILVLKKKLNQTNFFSIFPSITSFSLIYRSYALVSTKIRPNYNLQQVVIDCVQVCCQKRFTELSLKTFDLSSIFRCSPKASSVTRAVAKRTIRREIIVSPPRNCPTTTCPSSSRTESMASFATNSRPPQTSIRWSSERCVSRTKKSRSSRSWSPSRENSLKSSTNRLFQIWPRRIPREIPVPHKGSVRVRSDRWRWSLLLWSARSGVRQQLQGTKR